jgi:hypothetical protein
VEVLEAFGETEAARQVGHALEGMVALEERRLSVAKDSPLRPHTT